MKKEQFFHFRRHVENPDILIPPSSKADSRGGICIFAKPIEKENIILWGISKCHEGDNYNKSKARSIAEGRAMANFIRKSKGKAEVHNNYGTVSPFMDYEKVKMMAVEIANLLHNMELSSFSDIILNWENLTVYPIR